MRNLLLLAAAIAAMAFVPEILALTGTGGTPLGGMGTGYVVFDGTNFSVSGKMPPAGADKTETKISSSGFYFLAGTETKSKPKATSEDAKCPLQTADFGTIGGIKFTLNGFGPYLPGDGKDNFQLAMSPLALLDITAVNSGTAAVDVAVAMEFANGGLLGGATSATVETNNKAISFAGTADNAYLAVDCDGTTPTFSAGAIGTFATDGKLANTAGNLVGAKCSIAAGGTVHFKFILAWYRGYGSENYFYHNYYQNSKEVATFGLSKFDAVRNGITSFVSRVMASNFPDWYKDRLLNNTYPLIHNSVCAKDGRTAFWEGNYGIIGTIDQGEHAAVFYTFNWPDVQWHELQYCARQQKTNGQVHHDFNQGVQTFTAGSDANNRHLLAWDDKTHPDYWWFPNTDTWFDLNCMFIFKAYELMLATGNKDSVKAYWPAIKKTADRLISQCGSGSKLPSDQTHSTYDRCTGPGSGCAYTPEYNGSLALAAYQAISEIAKFCGQNEDATAFYDNYTAAKTQYKQKWGSSSTYGVSASVSGSGRFPESHIAGYSWANYLCLEPTMDKDWITATCKKMRDKQTTIRANGEWIFYCVDHYGGAEIAINMPDAAMTIHKQDYDYYYKQAPKEVFWQSLQEGDGNTHHDSYMTAPTVWHSYFQFCGYLLDNANNRLWIRPKIPTDMAGKITNAVLLNPKALGTLSYEETPSASGRTQTINISYDAPVTVKEIVLKNNTAATTPSVTVLNNGQPATITVKAEDWGIDQNIRVTLTTPIQIGPTGAKITVSKVPDNVGGIPSTMPACALALNTGLLRAGNSIHFSIDRTGPVLMELIGLNGATIGFIMANSLPAGNHQFQWNGKTMNNRPVAAGMALLRVSSLNGSVTKPVVIGR
jgi:hypothetical protein